MLAAGRAFPQASRAFPARPAFPARRPEDENNPTPAWNVFQIPVPREGIYSRPARNRLRKGVRFWYILKAHPKENRAVVGGAREAHRSTGEHARPRLGTGPGSHLTYRGRLV